jgi:hypothetical protein
LSTAGNAAPAKVSDILKAPDRRTHRVGQDHHPGRGEHGVFLRG